MQCSLLNYNFEFIRSFGADSLRLTQNMQHFECRINNKPFVDLMESSKQKVKSGLSDPELHCPQ